MWALDTACTTTYAARPCCSLLAGGDKSTQQGDIATAIRLAQDYSE
jgi:putative component of toxin-antitoxin plasmid stabilization module